LSITTYERGGTRWLWFQEKRGKEHEVPVHSKAKEAIDLWLERAYLLFVYRIPARRARWDGAQG
jgi:integrase